jgi:SAM-dependent methyltransferase
MPSCPVCGNSNTTLWSAAKDYEYFTSDETFNYFSCSACQCIFIEPVPADLIRLIYPSNYYSFVKTKKNIVTGVKEWLDVRLFKKILSRIDQKEIKVLDVGGGTGWLSSLIKKHDHRITCTQIIDIDDMAEEIAKANGHNYFRGVLENFETTEKYDLILMLNLIEHVQDPEGLLQKAAKLLSGKGFILIKTPNTESIDARIFKDSYWGGLHCPRHWVLFSSSSFRKLMINIPLEIDSLSFTQGGPFWAFSLIVALFRKGFIHVSSSRPVIYHPLFGLFSALGAAFDFIRRPISKTSQMFIILKH